MDGLNAIGVLLTVILAASSARLGGSQPAPGARVRITDEYLIRAWVSDDLSRVVGWVVAKRENLSPNPLEELHLRLYPNAFRPEGGISISGVTDGAGRPLEYEVTGPDETVLVVRAARPVGPGDVAVVNVSFSVTIPRRGDRFGRQGDVTMLGNWFPILSVRRGTEWLDHPYFWIGESFVSSAANLTLTVTYPSDCEAAATGVRVYSHDSDGLTTSRWVGEAVRDAALVLMRGRAKMSEELGDVVLECYYDRSDEDGARLALKTAGRAIEVFERLFGDYPYRTLEVVEVPAWFAGMEYPGLIMIGERIMEIPNRDLEMVVAHEVAHQWWYALVGNDQWEEPWLDEGLATYSECLYFESVYGEEEYERAFDRYVSDPLYSYLSAGRETPPTAASADSFDGDEKLYVMTAYDRGAWILRMLRYVMGDEAFFRGLRIYASRNRFGLATTADLKEAMEEAWGRDLDWFFEEWVYGSAVVSYDVEVEAGIASITPEVSGFRGQVKMPLEVEILWVNGSVARERVWVNGSVTLEIGGECEGVVPDPEDLILGRDSGARCETSIPGSSGDGGRPTTFPIWPAVLLAVVVAVAIIYAKVVRPPGFEPGSGAWQAPILPRLDYGRRG